MKTIILPGYSVHNKKWAYEAKDKLNIKGEIVVHEWQHWKDGSMSIPREVEKIRNIVSTESFNILAKSVGTRVAMHLIPKVINKLNKMVLCGIPTRGDNESTKLLYKNALSLVGEKNIIVIQNKLDPFASFDDIKKFIRSINPKILVIEKDRSDHDYPFFEDFGDFLGS